MDDITALPYNPTGSFIDVVAIPVDKRKSRSKSRRDNSDPSASHAIRRSESKRNKKKSADKIILPVNEMELALLEEGKLEEIKPREIGLIVSSESEVSDAAPAIPEVPRISVPLSQTRSRRAHHPIPSPTPTRQPRIAPLQDIGISHLKKENMEYFDSYLEFRNHEVDDAFCKFYALTHGFQSGCALVALPYLALIVSIFAINFTDAVNRAAFFLALIAVIQAIVLIAVGIYLYKHWELTNEYEKLSPSTTQSVSGSREASGRMVDNPQYSNSLFEEVSRHHDIHDVCVSKATWLGRYAALAEVCMISMLTTWCIGVALTETCKNFCVSEVPVLGIIFLWIVPLHMTLTTCVRWPLTFVCELISKLAILLSFTASHHFTASTINVVPLMSVFMVWSGLWLPLVYYVNRRYLNHFRTSESLVRVIDHYKTHKSDDHFDMWESFVDEDQPPRANDDFFNIFEDLEASEIQA
jgi:hypothetical protein